MNVIIDRRGPRLDDAANLRAFAVHLEDGCVPGDDLGACGIWSPDGQHAWIEPDWLREQAGPLAEDAGWQSGFSAMIDFARSKGWLDEQGRIRAHVASA